MIITRENLNPSTQRSRMFLYILLLICQQPGHGMLRGERKFHALQFGTTEDDFITFTLNMEHFERSFTLCMWIKKSAEFSAYPVVFDYWNPPTHEILVGAGGNSSYNRLFGDDSLDDIFISTPDLWYHFCMSWSELSGTQDVYYNGELTGSHTTPPGRILELAGIIRLGNIGNVGIDPRIFGGQLFKLNMFSEKLSEEQIKEMATLGLCTDKEEEYDEIRKLLWEEVMSLPRGGSVFEVDSGCPNREQFMNQINDLKDKLELLKTMLNVTNEELEASVEEGEGEEEEDTEDGEKKGDNGRKNGAKLRPDGVGVLFAVLIFSF